MKKLLVVIDYQHDFVDGTLGFATAKDLEKGIVNKIKDYLNNHDDVIFTKDTHHEDYLTTLEGSHLPLVHCVKNTLGQEFYGELKEYEDKVIVFEKPTFGSDKLYQHLLTHQYESIELLGLVTNICVIANAVIAKTATLTTEVIVDASLVGSYDETLHQKALDVLTSLQVNVINR